MRTAPEDGADHEHSCARTRTKAFRVMSYNFSTGDCLFVNRGLLNVEARRQPECEPDDDRGGRQCDKG